MVTDHSLSRISAIDLGVEFVGFILAILYENAPFLYRRNVGMQQHYSLPLDGGGRGGGDFHPSLCAFQGMTVSVHPEMAIFTDFGVGLKF